MNLNNESIPLVEKYRPKQFENIVLDPINKELLQNIIDTGYFPNLLFYGPPGTGKTTSIINLVTAYQEKHFKKCKALLIHLNASDDRGIDVIRTQLNQFVNSKTLFNEGMKFVILDEVDYMTKNAQQALRYLLQNYSGSVRFCLICNYISRIDEGLQTEFIKLRFNQLPEKDIIQFLTTISDAEQLHMSPHFIDLTQKLFKSDIRSMINFMQSNQNIVNTNYHIIDNSVWDVLYDKFLNQASLNDLNQCIQEISVKYNMDKKNIIKCYLNYIIRYQGHMITSIFLNFVENITHFPECKNQYYVNYSLLRLLDCTPKVPPL
jgi:replication factor C subunit 3/5